MASKIVSAAKAPIYAPLEWRRVGSNTDLLDGVLTQEQPVAPVRNQDETSQLRLTEQCELAYRQGEAMGRQSAQAELDGTMKALSRAIENAASHKSRLRQEAERDVVSLALAVARRILRRQIQVDDEAILGLVKAAFDNASLREITHVRVHPQFVSVVQSHLRTPAHRSPSNSRVTPPWSWAA